MQLKSTSLLLITTAFAQITAQSTVRDVSVKVANKPVFRGPWPNFDLWKVSNDDPKPDVDQQARTVHKDHQQTLQRDSIRPVRDEKNSPVRADIVAGPTIHLVLQQQPLYASPDQTQQATFGLPADNFQQPLNGAYPTVVMFGDDALPPRQKVDQELPWINFYRQRSPQATTDGEQQPEETNVQQESEAVVQSSYSMPGPYGQPPPPPNPSYGPGPSPSGPPGYGGNIGGIGGPSPGGYAPGPMFPPSPAGPPSNYGTNGGGNIPLPGYGQSAGPNVGPGVGPSVGSNPYGPAPSQPNPYGPGPVGPSPSYGPAPGPSPIQPPGVLPPNYGPSSVQQPPSGQFGNGYNGGGPSGPQPSYGPGGQTPYGQLGLVPTPPSGGGGMIIPAPYGPSPPNVIPTQIPYLPPSPGGYQPQPQPPALGPVPSGYGPPSASQPPYLTLITGPSVPRPGPPVVGSATPTCGQPGYSGGQCGSGSMDPSVPTVYVPAPPPGPQPPSSYGPNVPSPPVGPLVPSPACCPAASGQAPGYLGVGSGPAGPPSIPPPPVGQPPAVQPPAPYGSQQLGNTAVGTPNQQGQLMLLLCCNVNRNNNAQ